jgi:hypothetical protein
MVKVVKWSTDAATIDEVEDGDWKEFEPYDGPMPPRGAILLCDVKRITAEKFNSGSHGVKVLLEVNETDPKKEKFNGLAYWENVIDLPSTAFKIKQLMTALGSKSPGGDWNKTGIEPKDGVNYVVKFGNIRVEGAQVRVVHKTSKDQNDEPRAEVARFLPAGVASKASAPKARAAAAEPDEDEEAPF